MVEPVHDVIAGKFGAAAIYRAKTTLEKTRLRVRTPTTPQQTISQRFWGDASAPE